MSGVIDERGTMERLGLSPFVEGGGRAVLVEAFNRILVSAVPSPDVTRGIDVFEEKRDLLPFEEAKLFGHNAVHALLGYLAAFKGLDVMSRIREDPDLMGLGRRAFVDESGGALLRKYAALDDPLFTPAGYREYGEDLLTRMTNPYLNDKVERICRDPLRKLSYGDRLVGTMREALMQGLEPLVMAQGAAAALHYIVTRRIRPRPSVSLPEEPGLLAPRDVKHLLDAIWRGDGTDRYRTVCSRLIVEAYGRLIA
jgi:mannitol-1-phosphate 5-dehydrogenase